jgi:hypothetical protein
VTDETRAREKYERSFVFEARADSVRQGANGSAKGSAKSPGPLAVCGEKYELQSGAEGAVRFVPKNTWLIILKCLLKYSHWVNHVSKGDSCEFSSRTNRCSKRAGSTKRKAMHRFSRICYEDLRPGV